MAPARVRGALDRVAADGTVEGWCWSPDGAPRTVAVTLDGHVAGRAACNRPRDDLSGVGVPPGRHGFRLRLPAARVRPGMEAEVAVRDVATGQLLAPSRRVRWGETAPPQAPLLGNLDRVTRDGWVAGWCWDAARPSERLTVEVLVDDTVVGSGLAADWRADLGPAGIGDGAHGFTFALPYELLAEAGTIRVRVREAGTHRPVGHEALLRIGLRADAEDRARLLEREVQQVRARLDELARAAAARPDADERAARALFGTVAAFFQELAAGTPEHARGHGLGEGLAATLAGLRASLPPLAWRRPTAPRALLLVPASAPVAAVHRCLHALHAAGADAEADIRLLDAGRADPACALLPALVAGLDYLACAGEGEVAAARAAIAASDAPCVGFVDPWVEVGEDWLAEATTALVEEPAGGVTAQVEGGDGLVRHSGFAPAPGGLLADPALLADAGAHAWRALRPVPVFGAFACLFDRATLLRAGGLDPAFASLAHAVPALALQLGGVGERLVCQPAARARWSGPDAIVPDLTAPTEDARRLRRSVLRADGPGPEVGHALFVDDHVPRPDRDAGSVIALEHMRAMRRLGWRVTFAAATGAVADPADRARCERLGIAVAEPPEFAAPTDWLAAHGAGLGLAWITRHANATRLGPAVRAQAPDARLVFVPADLHALREGRAAALGRRAAPRRPLAPETWARELACVRAADATVLLSDVERDLLAVEADRARLHVLPWVARPPPPGPDFAARDGVLFVGGFGHRPNLDAVLWFASAVLPRLRRAAPGLRVHIAGADPPPGVLAVAAPDVSVHGWVADLPALLDQVRLTVAPLRFGAGFKGKVATSLAHGVPVVATGIALEGTGLADGDGVRLADTPAALAAAIVRLHEDAAEWNTLAARARERVAALYAPERTVAALGTLLTGLGLPVTR